MHIRHAASSQGMTSQWSNTWHNKWWDPPRSPLERKLMLGCVLPVPLISNSTFGNFPKDTLKNWMCHAKKGQSWKPLKSISSMSGKSRMSSWMSPPKLWPQNPRISGRRAPLLSSLSPQLRWWQEPPPQWKKPRKQGPQHLPGCGNDRLKWTLKNMEL